MVVQIYEYILRADIKVQQFLVMHHLESLHQLVEHFEGCLNWHPELLVQSLPQRLRGHLHHLHKEVLGLAIGEVDLFRLVIQDLRNPIEMHVILLVLLLLGH